MQRIILTFFLIGIVTFTNIFCMGSSLSYQDSSIGIVEIASNFTEYERLNLIKIIETKIFPKMDLIIEYPMDYKLKIENIYFLWRRKRSFFKRNWKKVISNIDDEGLKKLIQEVDFLVKIINSKYFKSFCIVMGYNVGVLSNID